MRHSARLFVVLVALLLAATACTRVHVWILAHDDMNGRDNNTPAAARARSYIISQIRPFATAFDGTTNKASYGDPFDRGRNIIAKIDGTTKPEEFVVVGAHYDHIRHCHQLDPGDEVCNGATDNAAGVAIALEIARALGTGPGPARTVIFAFWDREEDGLIGSRHWVEANPSVIDNVVAYVNYDIQGANLRPSLKRHTVAVGAETGGERLRDTVAANNGADLTVVQLSAVFGQNRSDYVHFIDEAIPTVFFTDATNGCYHTTGDDYRTTDRDKLDLQRDMGVGVVEDLANDPGTPSFTAAPLASYDDAVGLHELISTTGADRHMLTPDETRAQIWGEAITGAIVDAGEAAFDADDRNSVIQVALVLVSQLARSECDGFVD